MCVYVFFVVFFLGGGEGVVVAFSINNNVNKRFFYRYDSDKRMFPRYIEICTLFTKYQGPIQDILKGGSDV